MARNGIWGTLGGYGTFIIEERMEAQLLTGKECSRCGGDGTYSYCRGYGDRCFKCDGTGHTCYPMSLKQVAKLFPEDA
jgi:DnaJ-class molecular chaperone